MKKVLVIGPPGAGKSVFSRQLSKKTGLPLIHLDSVWHRPDRTHISRTEFDQFLERVFEEEAWILDGDYSRTYGVRFAQADTIFFLDYSISLCLEGIRRRMGQPRPDMPWIETKPDAEFEAYVAAYPAEQRPLVLQLIEQHRDSKTIVTFHAREDAAQYLEQL